MPDRENAIKGLAEISEYARAKADIAGIGKGKEVFDSWYRAAEDALALLREQEQRINFLEERLRLLEYGDQGTFQSGLMPAT